MANWMDRLKELGLALPPTPAPLATYVPARRTGDLVMVSGQLPLLDGKLLMSGLLKSDDQVPEAQKAMAQCLLNGIAAAGVTVDPKQIHGIVRLGAFVASEPSFISQHLVANGASDLAVQLFGEDGKHSRAAVGVASLPLNATVELEIVFQL